jgi:hypothetical protein
LYFSSKRSRLRICSSRDFFVVKILIISQKGRGMTCEIYNPNSLKYIAVGRKINYNNNNQ